MPERFRHYANQQLRWNKSFFRETLWVLKAFPPWHRVWLLSFGEIALWLCFTLSLVVAHVVFPLAGGQLPSAWFLAFLAVMAYARSIRYIGSQRSSLRSQIGVYLLAPVYGLLHIFVLMPIRLWALSSLRKPGWGTRKQVEVHMTSSLTARPSLSAWMATRVSRSFPGATPESNRPSGRLPHGRRARTPEEVTTRVLAVLAELDQAATKPAIAVGRTHRAGPGTALADVA